MSTDVRQLFRVGYLEVATGEGERQVVARMYLSGDIVRWVSRGLLSLPAEELEAAWVQHADELDALWKPWLRHMLAVLEWLQRGRSLAWWAGGIGSTIWGVWVARAGPVDWKDGLSLLLPLLMPAVRWGSEAVLRWAVRRQLQKLRGEE